MITMKDDAKINAMHEVMDKYAAELGAAKSARLNMFISFDHGEEELFKNMTKELGLTLRNTGSSLHAENENIVLIFWPKYMEHQNPELTRIMHELQS